MLYLNLLDRFKEIGPAVGEAVDSSLTIFHIIGCGCISALLKISDEIVDSTPKLLV